MFCSRVVMAVLPNIHLVGMLTVTFTVVFRKKALIPLYLYVLMEGLFSGFAPWWIGYLYIWTLLWGATMLLPKSMPRWAFCIVYPLLCGLHGALFGILYAPAEALMFGLDFEQTVAWVIAGLPFDFIHGVSNFFCGLLICPLAAVLRRLEKFSGSL